jgi:hypothetical protein
MIVKIVLRNFQGHRETEVQFNPGINIIRGRNEIGKTTINEAISFGFFGCDQFGKNSDHLITFGEEACEVTIQTDKATFVRRKKRGATPTIQLVRTGVPPINLNQTELGQLLGISFEVFGSCYNVTFFMELLEAKKLEVIGQIAKLDRRAILQSLVPGAEIPSKIKLENLKVDAQVISADRRMVQNQLAADQGALAQVETQMKEFHTDLISLNLEATKKEIESLTAQVDLFDLYHSDLVKFQSAAQRAKEQRDENRRIVDERARVELELKSLQGGQAPTQTEAALIEFERKIGNLKSNLETVPPPPAFMDMPEGNCPRCGQGISPKLKESADRERERAINAYNQEARLIEDRNTARLSQIEVWNNELREQIRTYNQAKTEHAVRLSKIDGFNKRLATLFPKEVNDPPVPHKPDGDEKAIRDKLGTLRAQFHAHQLFSQKKEQMVTREKMFRASIEQKLKQVGLLAAFEDALKKMPEVEVKQTLELLKTPGVLVEFGEDELLIMDERRVPYRSLSSGRKLKVSLALCRTFQRLVPRAPQFYFLDNVELMDEYRSHLPPLPAQVFIAKVDLQAASLQVSQL